MDHGSHTFYLAFEWMNAYPTAITAHSSTRPGFDTEDEFGCTLTFPTGTASAHLSWTSGMRKVLYTIHGSRGAIRIDDEDLEIAIMEKGPGEAAPGSAVAREGGEAQEQEDEDGWRSHAVFLRGVVRLARQRFQLECTLHGACPPRCLWNLAGEDEA
jgi:predicted dehydrogenase